MLQQQQNCCLNFNEKIVYSHSLRHQEPTLIFWYPRLKISILATEGTDYNEDREYPHAGDDVV